MAAEVLYALTLGGTLLLAFLSFVTAHLFRNRAVTWLAAALGLFALYTAVGSGYAGSPWWPDTPGLDVWLRNFLLGATAVGFYGYLRRASRAHRLGRAWAPAFTVVMVAFTLVAFFGTALPPADAPHLLAATDIAGRVLLAVVAVVAWRQHAWSTPLGYAGVAALCLQAALFYGAPGSALGVMNWQAHAGNVVLPAAAAGFFLYICGVLYTRQRQAAALHQRLEHWHADEHDRLEAMIGARTAEMQRALRSRAELLAYVSHDLRAPLGRILDAAHSLDPDAPPQSGARHLIEQQVQRQTDLIDELLEFSRDELGTAEPLPTSGYLYAFLAEVTAQSRLDAESRGCRLVTAIAPHLPPVVALDFRRLRQILANLVGNAAKFADHGTVSLSVTARPATHGRSAELDFAIQDTGAGLPESGRRRLLYQAFARGANAAGQPGYGLGLTIVTQLLGALGSHLEVDSTPGHGSRFSFVLATEVLDAEALEPVLQASADTVMDGAGRRILLVDGSARTRALLCDLLDGYGFDSHAVASVEEAVSALDRQAFSLVVTEQHFVAGDAGALLRRVRVASAYVPVLLYSDRPPSVQPPLPFDAVVLKQADGNELLRQIARLLSGARQPMRRTDAAARWSGSELEPGALLDRPNA
ncbi:MAG TPA: hybrid sensor histidine kinase/response regulator [Nevskiaceae bacterium]|nr:hybrid sensor histidine kinase/response regulator [Nevskiaceae bacterium]